jgi:hypothetical protein
MTDSFNAMTSTVLQTFGDSLLLRREGMADQGITGILTHGVQAVGPVDAVMQLMTTLTTDRSLLLRRGDVISKGEAVWRVDRRLKDDGYLTTWNLHAADH